MLLISNKNISFTKKNQLEIIILRKKVNEILFFNKIGFILNSASYAKKGCVL